MSVKTEDCEVPTPFTQSGDRDDEIILRFAEDKELYVSRNFLSYASPVFEAMFKHGFKEQNENCVEMTGKSYGDVLMLLLCIHPRVQKPVDTSNVLIIVPIAEEYQVSSITSKCRSIMTTWLLKSAANIGSNNDWLPHVEPLRDCLDVLTIADLLHYKDIIATAVNVISRFGHGVYSTHYTAVNTYRTSINISNGQKTLVDIRKECQQLFVRLPAEIRCSILSKRLILLKDDNTFK